MWRYYTISHLSLEIVWYMGSYSKDTGYTHTAHDETSKKLLIHTLYTIMETEHLLHVEYYWRSDPGRYK